VAPEVTADDDLPTHGLPASADAWKQQLEALAAGLAVSLVLALATPVGWTYGVMLGWIAAAGVYSAHVWLASWGLDAEGTARAAVREDPARAMGDVLLIVAAVASLVSVAFAIGDASGMQGTAKFLRAAAGVMTIVGSWMLVHTVFTLKYARAYYVDEDGGIDFNSDEAPRWTDFAYIAFTIGMTFQVSDTDLETSLVRRLALRHMFLSYLFGAVIIAVAINLIAGLTK
jgi:uncharacterized membrane protein